MNVASISKKGGRQCNQDYTDYAVSNDTICIAVADGLGAYHGSEFAGETAVRAVMKYFRKAVSHGDEIFSGAFMNKLFKFAHVAIQKVKSESPELRQCCTTLSVAIVHDDKLICAHTGDTRIYFFRDGKIEFFSKDHSLARLAADRGEITYDNIRTHKDQNKLTRVIGSDYFVQPDFKIYNGMAENDALLICTDGFWEFVFESDMENIISDDTDAKTMLTNMEEILLTRAPETNDNYTASLVLFHGDDSFNDVETNDETDIFEDANSNSIENIDNDITNTSDNIDNTITENADTQNVNCETSVEGNIDDYSAPDSVKDEGNKDTIE